MAKSAAAAKPAAGRSGGGLGVKFAVLALLAGALVALPLCLIALPGMVPTAAAFLIDRRQPRYLGYAVAVMNFSGVMPFLVIVAKSGMTLTGAAQKLADPFTWLIMYGAAAGGWLIYSAMIPLAKICVEAQAGQRRRQLESAAKAIRQEWGEEVAGKKKD
ncbi:MAG: hypothetical protein JO255_17145 [Alphaproteobacteria bacterium]|nr:hypothetical protein [Alphaproteobacteria bacterium]